MVKTKQKSPPSIEQIVVIFGTERLASLWARRNAVNPRRVMLATNGAEKLKGCTSAVTVRFPKDIWEPSTHPCTNRMNEVEAALKQIKQTGGEVIEYTER